MQTKLPQNRLQKKQKKLETKAGKQNSALRKMYANNARKAWILMYLSTGIYGILMKENT